MSKKNGFILVGLGQYCWHMSGKIILFGIGYVGRHVAKTLLQNGWDVVGTCRSVETQSELKSLGIQAGIFDGTAVSRNWDSLSSGATHILCSVPPQGLSDPVHAHFADRIAALKPTWLGYLSTTGVYGDWKGEWVDEDSETRGTSPRALARLAAEKSWLDLSISTRVFRLSGIYGPSRNAIENLSQGTARNLHKPGHYFSRIHVDDIVQTLIASMRSRAQRRIYNVADDEPSSSADVIDYAAKLMGITPPPRIDAGTAPLSDMSKDFYDNNKRVKNTGIKTELGVTLKYPTYREGLQAIWADFRHRPKA